MKNNLVKLLVAGSLLATGLSANDIFNEGDRIFVGGTVGGGSGSWSAETETTSYTPAEDGLSTTDMKIYVGKGSLYGFMQTGTITFDGNYNDETYTAYGVGYIGKMYDYRQTFAAGTIEPQYDVELAFDSMTFDDADATGFLLSADIGVAVSLIAMPALQFTADVGYDLHAVKTDAESEITYNFGSLNFNVGAKFSF